MLKSFEARIAPYLFNLQEQAKAGSAAAMQVLALRDANDPHAEEAFKEWLADDADANIA